jgi:translation initiation factor IF-2
MVPKVLGCRVKEGIIKGTVNVMLVEMMRLLVKGEYNLLDRERKCK